MGKSLLESHSHSILQSAPFGYAYHQILVDDQGTPQDYRFLDVNRAFEDLTGLHREEILGKRITQILPDISKDPANWIQVYGNLALNHETLNFEQFSQPLNKWFQVQAHSPEPGYFTTIFTDITPTKKAIDQLENFFQINLDLLCIADWEGRFIKVNHAWQDILGYPVKTLESRKFLDFVHPEDLDATLVALEQLAENKEVLDFTNRYRCQDGTYRYIQWRSKPKGDLIYAAARDVTDRIHYEHQLQDRETRLLSLFNSLDDLVLVLNPQNQIVEFQPSHEQRLLLPPEHFLGKSFAEIPFPEPAHLEILQALDQVQQSKEAHRITYALEIPDLKDAKTSDPVQWFDALLSPMFLPQGDYIGITAVIRNITEMKALTGELELKSQQLEEIITGTNAGTWQWQIQTGLVSFNHRWAQMIGYTLEELEPITIQTWETYTHPEDLARSARLLQDHFDGKSEYYECEVRMRHRDGHWVWVLDRGKVSHWSQDGKPLRMAGTHQDISKRKEFETELIQAREDALQATKAKSSFLSVMSHEIRTPLNGVIGFSDLLLKTPLNHLQKTYAENAKSSGVLLLEIINNILDFSKLEAGKLDFDYQQIDLLSIVKEVFQITKFAAREKNLELLLWTDPRLPTMVVSDPLRLKQILVNLMSNGVKFTPSGQVELAIDLADSDAQGSVGLSSHNLNSQDLDSQDFGATNLLRFVVRDTGFGMDSTQLGRLFQPFSQADSSISRKFGGTGLGLSIAKILVESMGGKIGVESQPGVGTSFTFTIPCPSLGGIGSGFDTTPKTLLDSFSVYDHVKPRSQESMGPKDSESPLRILVLEPHDRQREILIDYLKILGVEGVLGSNGLIESLDPFAAALASADGYILGLHSATGSRLESKFSSWIEGLKDPTFGLTPGLILSPDGQGQLDSRIFEGCPSMTWINKPIGFDDLGLWTMKVGEVRKANESPEPQSPDQVLTQTETMGPSAGFSDLSRISLTQDSMVILVADDVSMNLMLLEAYIKKLLPKAKVLSASNGIQALQVLKTYHSASGALPDLIFMDVQMPDMDGITATKAIRSTSTLGFSQVPIIALTAGTSQSDEQACLDAGMNGFLIKPLTLEALELFLKSSYPGLIDGD